MNPHMGFCPHKTMPLSVSVRRAASRPFRSLAPETLVEGITHAADSADRIDLAATLQAFAQTSDMHIDGALVDIDVAPPDGIEELRAAIDPARALHKIFEQAELGGRQSDIACRPRDPAGAPV